MRVCPAILVLVRSYMFDWPDFSLSELQVQYKLLSDTIGNLYNRCATPKMLQYIDHDAAAFIRYEKFDKRLSDVAKTCQDRMGKYEITKACEMIIRLLESVSAYDP